jgi:hypothetical protein
MASNINSLTLPQLPPTPDESNKKEEKAQQKPVTPAPTPPRKGDEVNFSGQNDIFREITGGDVKAKPSDQEEKGNKFQGGGAPAKDKDSKQGGNAPTGAGSNAPGGATPGSEAGSDKKEPKKPTFNNMNDRLNYVMSHLKEFDTAAGIDGEDKRFSIKDLNALKDGKGETAQVARDLINKDDVIGKLGGKDGRVSTDDIAGYQKDHGGVLQVTDGVKLDTKGMNDKQIKNARNYIEGLAEDEDGKKLIKGATEKEQITVTYDPSYKDGMGAAFVPSEHSIHMSKKMLDQEGGHDPTDIMGMTGFAHEFVHAATDKDVNDDSKMEESIATALGSRIAGRYYGKKVDTQKVFQDWIGPDGWTSSNAYKDLCFDNGISEDLKKLGIDVSEFKKPKEPGK